MHKGFEYWAKLFLVAIAVLFVAHLLGLHSIPDSGTQETEQRTREAKEGLAKYYRIKCEQGDQRSCDELEALTGEKP